MSEPINAGGRVCVVCSWPLVVGAAGVVALTLLAGAELEAADAPQAAKGSGGRPPRRDAKALEASLRATASELDLEAEVGAGKALLEAGKKQAERRKKAGDKDRPSFSSPLEKLLAARADLRGLPLLAGKACESDKEQAHVLFKVANHIRRGNTEHVLHADHRYLSRPLDQVCQSESEWMRQKVVATLARIETKDAAQVLARRAVFDLLPAVREAATEALKDRAAGDVREVFLAALRHPWTPAADHAAVALVETGDRDAVLELKKLLDQPDPATPTRGKDGKWRGKQLVRVNHLRNCLLCHPPSVDANDPVRGVVPVPGEPMPTLPQAYYGNTDSKAVIVRADVVYFRQDFSAMHKVKDPNKWPEIQRFDYLVRSREWNDQAAEAALKKAKEAKTYPQREAVRWALAKLIQAETRPSDAAERKRAR